MSLETSESRDPRDPRGRFTLGNSAAEGHKGAGGKPRNEVVQLAKKYGKDVIRFLAAVAGVSEDPKGDRERFNLPEVIPIRERVIAGKELLERGRWEKDAPTDSGEGAQGIELPAWGSSRDS